jgi:hypothetical protein
VSTKKLRPDIVSLRKKRQPAGTAERSAVATARSGASEDPLPPVAAAQMPQDLPGREGGGASQPPSFPKATRTAPRTCAPYRRIARDTSREAT